MDIFNIKPNVVSKDLCGYTVLMYGQPKTGKTTTAAKFDKALLCAFEVGYLTIPGVMAQPINRWSEFKQVIRQLDSEEGHKTYKNIVIDTADICYDLCEKYICSMEGVSAIGDIPYGGGYAKAKKEFDETLRRIPAMGYGLILISHAQDKTFKDENGSEYQQIVPTLGNQPRLVVDRMSDIIIYVHPVEEEDGTVHSIGYLRGTPRFVAGSRFKYMPDFIEFNYETLVKTVADAVDAISKNDGKEFVTDKPTSAHEPSPEIDFDALMNEFKTLVDKIQKNTGADFGKKWAPIITSIVEKHLGKGKKVNDMSRDQGEQLILIVDDLVEVVGNGL